MQSMCSECPIQYKFIVYVVLDSNLKVTDETKDGLSLDCKCLHA